jgi:hypothetical protein
MRIVSDSCKCSACLNKYYCQDYALIVSIQKHAKEFLKDKNNDIQLVFQVEYCIKRKVR